MIRRTAAVLALLFAASLSAPSAMAGSLHAAPATSPVRIVKIHYAQTGTNLNTEYIVIHNITAKTVAVTGWTMTSSPATDNQSHTFGPTKIGPQHYVTLYTGSGTISTGKRYWGAPGPVWNNDGDYAVLTNSGGGVMDTCRYAGGGTTALC
jgi:hypothetical protein